MARPVQDFAVRLIEATAPDGVGHARRSASTCASAARPAGRRRSCWRPRCGRCASGRFSPSFADVRAVATPVAAAPAAAELRGRGRGHRHRRAGGDAAGAHAGGVSAPGPPGFDAGAFDGLPAQAAAPGDRRPGGSPAGSARGERKTGRAGGGLEFADHRDYAPGDDLRRIDWNLFGRMEKPLVRLFEAEEELPVYVLLDRSASMGVGGPPKLELAAQVAAALAYLAARAREPVQVYPFASAVGDALSPLRGRAGVHPLPRAAGGAGGRRGGPTWRRPRSGCWSRHRRRGLVVVVSDFFGRPDARRRWIGCATPASSRWWCPSPRWRTGTRPTTMQLLVVDAETGASAAGAAGSRPPARPTSAWPASGPRRWRGSATGGGSPAWRPAPSSRSTAWCCG